MSFTFFAMILDNFKGECEFIFIKRNKKQKQKHIILFKCSILLRISMRSELDLISFRFFFSGILANLAKKFPIQNV